MEDLITRLNATLVGRYAIQRELGHGGMAIVFLADDLRHHRRVAIKVLPPEVTAAIGAERFLREIEIAAGLSHPHILPLHDSGIADGLLYYVMPYAEGESLRQRLTREKQLPVEVAVRLTREIADALDYAHRQGFVHRDIKPENILLVDQHATVADFGIARAIAAVGGDRLTATGLAVGTAAYMSPEQVVGRADIDGKSDQYSLGCVLYEMLAGQPPFSAPTAESLAHQHLHVQPRPITQLRPTAPVNIERALARALAKGAADRYETTAQFAAALMPTGEHVTTPEVVATGEQTVGVPRNRIPRAATNRRRAWLAVAGLGAAALLAAVIWRWESLASLLRMGGVARAAGKDWVLVAEFDGPSDDSLLTSAARDLVGAAIDQSIVAASVPRDQIRLVLQRAGKPANSRVGPDLARELAYRSAVRAVLEGSIGRLGKGYSVVLRLVDADSNRLILTQRGVARNEDDLIPVLGRLSERLCESLRANRGAILPLRSPWLAATPSFEAYRLFVRGNRLFDARRFREAIALWREALLLDPEFAHAWARIGSALGNLGAYDSARVATDEALRLSHRLPEMGRLNLKRLRAGLDGDLHTALATVERMLELNPSSPGEHLNKGFYLVSMGRIEEALENTQKAERLSPFGPTQIVLRNEVIQLCALGRIEEARNTAQLLGPTVGRDARAIIATQANDWALVEAIKDSLAVDPAEEPVARALAVCSTGGAQAARGAFSLSAQTLARAERLETEAPEPKADWRNYIRRARMMLTLASGGIVSIPAESWQDDSSAAALLTQGYRAALRGDRDDAERLLRAARTRPALELVACGESPALLQAQIHGLRGNWNLAANTLRSIADQRYEYGLQMPGMAGISPIRWHLADAFENLGKFDSAAVVLERSVSDPAARIVEFSLRAPLTPFMHRRLVLLYARMGRLDEARMHWREFTRILRTPDPELQPLIVEARNALAAAEATTPSTN